MKMLEAAADFLDENIEKFGHGYMDMADSFLQKLPHWAAPLIALTWFMLMPWVGFIVILRWIFSF